MSTRARTLPLAAAAALFLVGSAPPAKAAMIVATTQGFADQTPDFYGVAFLEGEPGTSIATVTFTLPAPGFFDFDGDTGFQDATAPVLHLPSLVGLAALDITFRFTGIHDTLGQGMDR